MKRLGSMTLKERSKHAEDIRNAVSEVNAEIDKWNAAIETAKADLEAAVTKLNEALNAVCEWRDAIVADMENYVSDRSEKWQESDAASEYESWKQEFDNLELDDVEIEFPDALEHVEEEKADAIDNLPESPG